MGMIAGFLALRLYSVLGRRAKHEEEVIQGRIDPVPGTPRTHQEPRKADALPQQQKLRELPVVPPAVERGLHDIAAVDRRFDAPAFIDGARHAYRMILEAFWRGDKDELASLVDRDVYENFAGEIDARIAAGETVENRLVRIEEVSISDASYDAPMARITVRFVADIAALTRDKDGTAIAGSLDDALVTRDLWTFSRNVTATAPDWLLDETDEA